MISAGLLGALLLGAGFVAVMVAVLPPATAAVLAGLALVVTGVVVRLRTVRPAPAPPPPPVPPPPREVIGGLLDLFAEGILLLDDEQTVIAANQAAATLLGRPLDAMIGVSLIRAARDHALVEVLREAAGAPREVLLGAQRVIYASAARVNSGEIRMVLTLQDLTALRRAERARQELVANVSHELRTPIAAAMALAETLESGVEEQEQRDRFHRQLTAEIERLGRMVDRLLRLSRIESHIEEFDLQPVSMPDLLDEAIRRISPVAERRTVELRAEVEPGTPSAEADRERVLEVLANLIDNALKYSPEGGLVRLRAGPQGRHVRIDVIDQGPGIMPQERSRVFERFYTADRARTDGRGTGLGLAIARHIVQRHGGEIWVAEATPGATLSFTLPQSPAVDARTPDAEVLDAETPDAGATGAA